jgi:hypothetical protein
MNASVGHGCQELTLAQQFILSCHRHHDNVWWALNIRSRDSNCGRACGKFQAYTTLIPCFQLWHPASNQIIPSESLDNLRGWFPPLLFSTTTDEPPMLLLDALET